MAFGLETFGSNAWGYGDVSISVTSDTLTVSMGDEATSITANVTLTTNLLTMSQGSVIVLNWTEVTETQTPSWSEITETQTASWSEVSTTQTASWSEISTI